MVIDELPYAAEGNDALPSILQGVWDEVLIKNTPTGPSALAELRAKEEAHFPRGEEWLWLFSKSGFTDDGRWAADDPRVRLVDPEELGL